MFVWLIELLNEWLFVHVIYLHVFIFIFKKYKVPGTVLVPVYM